MAPPSLPIPTTISSTPTTASSSMWRQAGSIRTAETGAARTMIDRVMDRFGLYPERLIADTAYGSGSDLGWLVEEHGIEPHIPVIDKSDRASSTFSAREFTYDRKTDAYTCPAGQKLKPYWRDMSRAPVPNSATPRVANAISPDDRIAAPVRSNPDARRTSQPERSPVPSTRALARWRGTSPSPERFRRSSRKLRKKVEMLFAHLKRILGLGRLRLRGPCGAKDEFLLAATAQNLRKLAKLFRQVPSQKSRDQAEKDYSCEPRPATFQNDFFNGIGSNRSSDALCRMAEPPPFSALRLPAASCCRAGKPAVTGTSFSFSVGQSAV